MLQTVGGLIAELVSFITSLFMRMFVFIWLVCSKLDIETFSVKLQQKNYLKVRKKNLKIFCIYKKSYCDYMCMVANIFFEQFLFAMT